MLLNNISNTGFRFLLNGTKNCFRISNVSCVTLPTGVFFLWQDVSGFIQPFRCFEYNAGIWMPSNTARRISLQQHNVAHDTHRVPWAYHNIFRYCTLSFLDPSLLRCSRDYWFMDRSVFRIYPIFAGGHAMHLDADWSRGTGWWIFQSWIILDYSVLVNIAKSNYDN